MVVKKYKMEKVIRISQGIIDFGYKTVDFN